jgi:hypothetical protein
MDNATFLTDMVLALLRENKAWVNNGGRTILKKVLTPSYAW